MYSNTKCAVRKEIYVEQDFLNTTLGVKQGDNLSPNLISLLI